jgi:hypothetical protein
MEGRLSTAPICLTTGKSDVALGSLIEIIAVTVESR